MFGLVVRVDQRHPFGTTCSRTSTRFSLSMEMSRLTRDGTAEPVSRDQILRPARGQGNIIFPVQLTTSRIGNLTRLIHTLLYVMTIHTYIQAVTCKTRDNKVVRLVSENICSLHCFCIRLLYNKFTGVQLLVCPIGELRYHLIACCCHEDMRAYLDIDRPSSSSACCSHSSACLVVGVIRIYDTR